MWQQTRAPIARRSLGTSRTAHPPVTTARTTSRLSGTPIPQRFSGDDPIGVQRPDGGATAQYGARCSTRATVRAPGVERRPRHRGPVATATGAVRKARPDSSRGCDPRRGRGPRGTPTQAHRDRAADAGRRPARPPGSSSGSSLSPPGSSPSPPLGADGCCRARLRTFLDRSCASTDIADERPCQDVPPTGIVDSERSADAKCGRCGRFGEIVDDDKEFDREDRQVPGMADGRCGDGACHGGRCVWRR